MRFEEACYGLSGHTNETRLKSSSCVVLALPLERSNSLEHAIILNASNYTIN